MRTLYAAALLLLASCAHPNQPAPPQSEPIGADAVPVDASKAVGQQITPPVQAGPQVGAGKGFFGKLFTGKTAPTPTKTLIIGGAEPGPRKCKGCTVIYSAGPATVTTSTVGKKAQGAVGDGATATQKGDTKAKGGAVVTQDSSSSNALTGGGNLAAVKGDGNTLDQKKQDTTHEALGVGATIAKAITGPVGIVLAAGLCAGAIYLIVVWRKKKAAENLV